MSLGTTPAVAPRRPTGGKPAPPRGQPRPATSSRRTRRRRRRPCSKPATARCAASWRATAGSISTSADWNAATGRAEVACGWRLFTPTLANRYAATGRAEASCSSGGGGGGDLPDRAERVERISRGEFGTVQPSARRAGFDRPARPQRAQLAESFSECAFLFAKVGPLQEMWTRCQPCLTLPLTRSMGCRRY